MSQLLQPENLARLDAPSCKLGEGPTYDPRTDTAWWFDIIGRKLLEHRFRDSRTLVHDLPFMASALARIDDRQPRVGSNGVAPLRGTDRPQATPHSAHGHSLLIPVEEPGLPPGSNVGHSKGSALPNS